MKQERERGVKRGRYHCAFCPAAGSRMGLFKLHERFRSRPHFMCPVAMCGWWQLTGPCRRMSICAGSSPGHTELKPIWVLVGRPERDRETEGESGVGGRRCPLAWQGVGLWQGKRGHWLSRQWVGGKEAPRGRGMRLCLVCGSCAVSAKGGRVCAGEDRGLEGRRSEAATTDTGPG